MKHDEFIGQVQARAQLASRGEAERATRATLETLGARSIQTLTPAVSALRARDIPCAVSGGCAV